MNNLIISKHLTYILLGYGIFLFSLIGYFLLCYYQLRLQRNNAINSTS